MTVINMLELMRRSINYQLPAVSLGLLLLLVIGGIVAIVAVGGTVGQGSTVGQVMGAEGGGEEHFTRLHRGSHN